MYSRIHKTEKNRNKIINGDCLEVLKNLEDNSVDLMFCDPPYALGSDVIILPNGKPEYKKAVDFMSKWKQPNGEFWEDWFREANRVLKHGGHCLLFGLDRQTMLYKYYACFAGFVEKQSLYWYFISNFPKASDLSKNIDKYFGLDREILGKDKNFGKTKNKETSGDYAGEWNITKPNHPLAQKYDGYKYSIAPLKQTNETIMVFQKPYKTGSCLHDVLALENGDDTITCGALDIQGNRVGTEQITNNGGNKNGKNTDILKSKEWQESTHSGRFPSQTFCDTEASKILDKQSGVLTSGAINPYITTHKANKSAASFCQGMGNFRDYKSESNTGGCSKILHKCDYEQGNYDIYQYCSKVSKKERGIYNNHPTVKPIKLLSKILGYFKTPNKQVLLDCFMGSGSMGIASQGNFEYIGIELDEAYFDIAKKRIEETKEKQNDIVFSKV